MTIIIVLIIFIIFCCFQQRKGINVCACMIIRIYVYVCVYVHMCVCVCVCVCVLWSECMSHAAASSMVDMVTHHSLILLRLWLMPAPLTLVLLGSYALASPAKNEDIIIHTSHMIVGAGLRYVTDGSPKSLLI